MNRVMLRVIDANSCIRLCMVVMVMIGAVVGVFSFVFSFFGFDPKVHFILWELHGIPAGIASILVCPLLGAIFALGIGLLACLCLNTGMRFLHGIEVRGLWDNVESRKNRQE